MCKNNHQDDTPTECFPMKIPSTVLSTLIDNAQFDDILDIPPPSSSFFNNKSRPSASEIVYYKDNLSKLPDVNDTGRDYYTYWHYFNIPSLSSSSSLIENSVQDNDGNNHNYYYFLSFQGLGYASKLYHHKNDEIIGQMEAEGMFSRHMIDITKIMTTTTTTTTTANKTTVRLLIEPPYHPGQVTSKCKPNCTGQGGNHELAKDAGSIQFVAGWDWIQGIPDRNTGIWDRVEVIQTLDVRIEDSAIVRTVEIDSMDGSSSASLADTDAIIEAVLEVEATLINNGNNTIHGMWKIIFYDNANHTIYQTSIPQKLQPLQSYKIIKNDIHLQNVQLWWPHTMGEPYLYNALISYWIDDAILSDSSTFNFGIRTITSYIHPKTKGRAFKINSVPIFLQGGNWITTDAMLQYSTSPDRYYDELYYHRSAGLNFIRIWGGGITERPIFYEIADQLGILVMQEFWLTGDNNGRWGGSYDWPYDVDLYLKQVEDVVKTLRYHPSLMFWCGGNELWPKSKSPRLDIREGMERLMKELDYDRFFIMSSMDGGRMGYNYSDHDDHYALVVKDGPYGFLEPSTFFRENNPGMVNGTEAIVSFQPEIGSSSMPRYESLVRMGLVDHGSTDMNTENFPSELDKNVPPLWNYHNFEGYTIHTNGQNKSYNAIYQYGKPTSIEEYAARAQLACYQQYQSLIEGFTSKMFDVATGGGKTAVTIWKTQSPWPSMRGFLYDWFLDSTGTYHGVQAGTGGAGGMLGSSIHVQLNLESMRIELVNRGRMDVNESNATVEIFDIWSKKRYHQSFTFENMAMGSVGTSRDAVSWPLVISEFSFVRIRSSIESVRDNWYWMRRMDGTYSTDYSILGAWRDGKYGPKVKLDASLQISDPDCSFLLKMKVTRGVVFYPTFTARNNQGVRVMPLFTDHVPMIILEGEEVTVHLRLGKTAQIYANEIKTIEIDMWAGGRKSFQVPGCTSSS